MGSHVIVLPAKLVQPQLYVRHQHSPPRQRSLQLAVKPLYLALGLGMSHSAPVQPDALPHQPQRQLGHSARTVHAPPWRAVVHQHRLRHAVLAKGRHQRLLHLLGVRARHRVQHNHVAAVIVDHRQRPDFLMPQLRTFEVHLPQFIRRAALEPLHRRLMPVFAMHQVMPQQNAMNRIPPQLDSLTLQQHSQLA